MAYNRNTLSTAHKPYYEIKTINGRQYLYKRWVETNGGTLIRRSQYVGKPTSKR